MPMDDLNDLVQEILEKGYLMSLATVDDGGPWVSDVVYVSDGLDIYWISKEETRHSQAIINHSSVAATITISNQLGEQNVGLQIAGTAQKIDGEIYKMAVAHRLKRKKDPPKEDEQFLKSTESWYLLKPTKVEIIYEPKWGYEKKELVLKK